jgi:predicted GNAT superfamily acetyltransferase
VERWVTMRRTLEPPTASAERACARAQEIAEAAGIEVLDVEDLADLNAVSGLFDQLWGTGRGDSYLAPSHLRAMTHAGNYCAGAFSNGSLVGGLVAFLGQDGEGTYLHSHILGVSPTHRGSNVGFALKQHQRAWALEHGLAKVTWTFDPLVRRNAFFNLHKLGAGVGAYLVNFYGDMEDDINGGDESDRILVDWRLGDARVGDAAETRLDETDVASLDATVALDDDGNVSDEPWRDAVVCATPEDVVELRRVDRDAAERWRGALRSTLGRAINDGYRVTDVTRSGWYVLERA